MVCDQPDLADVGHHPISEAAPAGEDPFASPEFQALTLDLKRARLDPQKAPWRDLARTAQDLLTTHGKDLRAATYLIEALTYRDGFEGMALGLRILHDLAKTFGADLHPRRVRARDNAIRAMGETLPGLLTTSTGSKEDLKALHNCLMLVMALEVMLPQALDAPEIAFPLVALRKRLVEMTRNYQPEEVEPGEASPASKERASVGEDSAPSSAPRPKLPPPLAGKAALPPVAGVEPRAAPTPIVATPSDAPENGGQPPPQARPVSLAAPELTHPRTATVVALATGGAAASPAAVSVSALQTGTIAANRIGPAIQQVKAAMSSLAEAWRHANPAEPRAYALARHALWFEITGLPPLSDQPGGVAMRGTNIPPPDAEAFKSAEQRLAGTDDPAAIVEIVDRLETMVFDSPFWLNPHRLVAEALEALGHDYEAARRSVTVTTAAFVQRLPGLVDLSFQKGVPFLDGKTRSWLLAGAPAGQLVDAADANGTSGLAEIEAKAGKLAGEDRAREGLALFTEGRRALSSERKRFEWDLAQARYCRDHGFRGVALSLLESLETRLIERHLEDWEPAWVAEHAVLLLGLYGGEPADAGGSNGGLDRRQAVHRLFGRLSRLDPVAATGYAKFLE